jgi:hypothetical protein
MLTLTGTPIWDKKKIRYEKTGMTLLLRFQQAKKQ